MGVFNDATDIKKGKLRRGTLMRGPTLAKNMFM